jgi:Holliday junction resolvasome RuvABC endonuclease subunit
MLHIPHDGDGIVKFVGFDPGTSFPGVGLLHYDVEERKIVRATAIALNLEKMAKRSPHFQYQNLRYLKLQAFRMYQRALFRKERPMAIASEHPYINPRMPGAVIPLAECLYMTEQEVHAYNPYMCLERIDPSSIKNAVGVKGNSGEKHAMTEAIKKIPEIMDVLVGDIDSMDNNAVDSLAVAYCSLKRELNHGN